MVAPVQQVAIQQPVAACCAIYSQPTHDFMSCPQRDTYPDFVAEQVNAFNNYPRQGNDVHSNFYNPGWRDRPNLKWGGEQQVKPPFPPPIHVVRALRSGKSYDNSEKEIDSKDKAARINNPVSVTAEKDVESVSAQILNNPNSAPIQNPERVYDPPLPYPERLQPKLKDQQLRDFM
ncbi:hypothetical protein ACFX2K_024938 [Malus domestica]